VPETSQGVVPERIEIPDYESSEEHPTSALRSFLTFKGLQFVFLQKGNALIYIGTSKNDSPSFLRKQLEQMHLQIISITTKQVLKMLINDPSFDFMSELWSGLPLLRHTSSYAHLRPSTLFNMYPPLRTSNSKEIPEHLDFALSKFKPADSFYFGVIFAEQTVVATFKTGKYNFSASGRHQNLLLTLNRH
jgi:hypothetical protein